MTSRSRSSQSPPISPLYQIPQQHQRQYHAKTDMIDTDTSCYSSVKANWRESYSVLNIFFMNNNNSRNNTKKNDDGNNDYDKNNKNGKADTHRRRQAVAIFQQNGKLAIAALLIFIMITYQCYQYYMYKFVYRPHYSYDNNAFSLLSSRSQRFPTVHQRIQIYMSNWYIQSPSFSDCPNFQKNQHTVNTTTHWVYDYSPEYRNTGIKYHVLKYRGDQKMKLSPPATVVTNQVQIGTIFFTDIVQLHECYRNLSYSIRYYCRDMMESMLVIAPYSIPLSVLRFLSTYDVLFYHVLIPFIDRINNKNKKTTLPIMVQFSDETESWIYSTTSSSVPVSNLINLSNMDKSRNPKVPHIKKIRYALHKTDIDRIMSRTIHNEYSDPVSASSERKCHIPSPPPPQVLTGMKELQPILWLLNENRHFKYTWDINRYDQSYSAKKNMSVFRGMLTGPDIDPLVDDYTNCMLLPRCRLVYQTFDSPYVDAKITDTLNKLPDVIHDRNITGTHLWKEDVLSYKGIVILEGNDVSSGLKWAMVSNSVVLMSPNITYSSWMMEELLQPYVHYIPIDIDTGRTDNKNNIEAQTIWMLQHEAEVQRIIHRAKLWILDLYYHPDARRDRDAINAGILEQYQQYFSITTTLASLD